MLTCTENADTALKVLAMEGRPCTLSGDKVYIDHTWVSSEIDEVIYNLDVSFKTYREVQSLNDMVDSLNVKFNIDDFKDTSDLYWFLKDYENNSEKTEINVTGKTIVKKKLLSCP